MTNSTEQTYEITDESWNPSGEQHLTESDIRSLIDVFGLDSDLLEFDSIGRVIYNEKQIGQAE